MNKIQNRHNEDYLFMQTFVKTKMPMSPCGAWAFLFESFFLRLEYFPT